MTVRLAVDIGSHMTALALVAGDEPSVLAYQRLDSASLFDTASLGAEEALLGALETFMAERRIEPDELLGVGIGVPGAFDREQHRILVCPNLPTLNGQVLGPGLAARLGTPVKVENDANLMALGELTAGLGRGLSDLALVAVGAGLGSGLIRDGAIYHGMGGATMELGHTKVAPDGRTCSCGAHGCLEMYCSGKALAAEALRLYGDDERLRSRSLDAAFLIEQAHAGDEAARQALHDAFTALGLALANLINALHPGLIVIAGEVALAWKQGTEVARQVALAEALPGRSAQTRILESQLEPYAGVLGAAALCACGDETASAAR
jgi:predicted NBD/HSP70 family sugar kinase